MMGKLRIIFQQTLMVAIGILLIFGAEGVAAHVMGKDYIIEWYQPFTIICTGFLCSLPTLFLIYDENAEKSGWLLRLLLHCLTELAVVSAAGFFFRWYGSLKRFCIFVVEYFAVYLFACLATIFVCKTDEIRINEALKNIQDEE